MSCTTRWCHNTSFVKSDRPVNYTTHGTKLDWQGCPSCGASWVDRSVEVLQGRMRPRLYEYNDATQEIHSRKDNARFEGSVAGGRKGR